MTMRRSGVRVGGGNLFAKNQNRACWGKRRPSLPQAASGSAIKMLEGRTLLSVTHWINPAGGDFDNPANWDQGVPSGNDAVIDIPVSSPIVKSQAAAYDRMSSLTCTQPLVISGGTLQVGGQMTVSGPVSLANCVVQNAVITSTTSANITVTGNTMFNGVSFAGSAAITIDAGAILTAQNGLTFDGADVSINGDGGFSNWAGISIINGSQVTLDVNSNWTSEAEISNVASSIALAGTITPAEVGSINQSANGTVSLNGVYDGQGTTQLFNGGGLGNGGTILNTVLNCNNLGLEGIPNANAFLDGDTFEGTASLELSFTIRNGLKLDQATLTATAIGAFQTYLVFDNSNAAQAISGTGPVYKGASYTAELQVTNSSSTPHPLTIGPNITVEGACATIDGGTDVIVNQGTILADNYEDDGGINISSLDNQGTLAASPGSITIGTFNADTGTMEVGLAQSQQGSFNIAAGGSPVTLSGDLVVTLLGNFVPSDVQYAVMQYPSYAGSFASMSLTASGVTFTPVFYAQKLVIYSPLATVQGNSAPPDYSQNVGDPAITANGGVEVGLKFQSDTAGIVRGVRFFKGDLDNGVHTGELWDASGDLLASAAFTNESASGWQSVTFSTPVVIEPNVTYIVSYHTTGGTIAYTPYHLLNSGIDNGPLHILANSPAIPNGSYAYGATSQFPAIYNGRAPNYWVDVVFNPDTPLTVLGASQPDAQYQNVEDPNIANNGGVNVGFQFSAGGTSMVGIRYFRGALDTGVTTGELWDSAGNLLASVTFSNQASPGWQYAYFAKPVELTWSTNYTVSYHTTSPFIAYTSNPGLAFAVSPFGINGVLSSSWSQSVYSYGAVAAPTVANGRYPNYWVDPLLVTS